MMESWPEPLIEVDPIESVPVTSASVEIPCLLTVHAPRTVTDGWPESLHSQVGTIVHKLIERLAVDPQQRQVLIKSPEEMQSCLLKFFESNGIDNRHLGNIRHSSQRTLKRALESMPVDYQSIVSTSNNRSRDSENQKQFVSESSTEGWIRDLELGVRGKFDLRIEIDDEIRIDDFKTGSVNGDDVKLEKWQRQVAIYTLVSVRQQPNIIHTARIIAADGTFEVPTSSDYLRQLERELIAQKAKWPTQPTTAHELANLCSMCRQCRVRHVCLVYLSKTPWVRDPELDLDDATVWSWDVWGKVQRTSTKGRQHALVLNTSTSRVIINGFGPEAGIAEVHEGSFLGVFGVRKDRNYSDSSPVFRANQGNPHMPTRLMLDKRR